ncbi:DNA topoisomerase VI subunit B [Candidatus Woesearchaeota archaeon]|nr:DNA topoisomerase VI subunit B [Candidatus Woesearchaeota archaeon]
MVTVAEELAKKQREISISEFFLKNRHLLGFDNPTRALMMVVKEAVDNSLDACTEMKVLPEIKIELKQINENRFIVIVEDNGPGIVKQQIPNIFGKLLYGSKFHTLKMNRGQQGLGISAAVLYSQLTTGKSTKIYSIVGPKKAAHYFELQIDTKKNEPNVLKDQEVDWEKDHGTKIEIEIEGRYLKGRQSVDGYVKETAIVNPHATFIYIDPEKQKLVYERVTEELPIETKEIKPHPYGIELGHLIKMLQDTRANTLAGFLQSEFSRIGQQTAKEICDKAGLKAEEKPKKLDHKQIEILFKSLQETKIMAPPGDCLSPIKAELLEKGLRKEINADFYITATRSPAVYRGMPFQVEVGIAYGGEIDKESQIRLMRFANRVPLLYQQGACAITEAVTETNWKPYGLQQSGNNMPTGPAIILVHIASVWVPFTNEAKEAIAHYDEIIKEIKLALQECGRKLSIYIHRHIRAAEQREKISLFEKYIPELVAALSSLTNNKKDSIQERLQRILKKELPSLEAENDLKKEDESAQDLKAQRENKKIKNEKKEKQTTL